MQNEITNHMIFASVGSMRRGSSLRLETVVMFAGRTGACVDGGELVCCSKANARVLK
jgi:hypothetical protein